MASVGGPACIAASHFTKFFGSGGVDRKGPELGIRSRALQGRDQKLAAVGREIESLNVREINRKHGTPFPIRRELRHYMSRSRPLRHKES